MDETLTYKFMPCVSGDLLVTRRAGDGHSVLLGFAGDDGEAADVMLADMRRLAAIDDAAQRLADQQS